MMGYVCFHFNSCDCGNFMKIPQTVNMLNNALGGYRNLRHKHYLMNKIDKMYSTDLLTGLLNRRGFTSELDRMLRKNQPPFDVTYSYSFSAGGDAADDAEAAEETTEAGPTTTKQRQIQQKHPMKLLRQTTLKVQAPKQEMFLFPV